MLEELLKHEKLGNRNELSFFLFKALAISQNQKRSDLKAYCISNHYTVGQSVDGILKLLEFMGYVKVSGGQVVVEDDFFASIQLVNNRFDESKFVRTLLILLKNMGLIEHFFPPDAIKLDHAEKVYYIKESHIPLQYMGVRNLLISLGFFGRNPLLGSYFLTIDRAYADFFFGEIINDVRQRRSARRRKTLQSLKEQQERQEFLGKEAELFVVKFEQQRLIKHPLPEAIQRISEDFVNAGYDIESFNDIDSVFVDRFIEVKSYSGVLQFYWSANEVEIAKEFAENYFLYLVDRSKTSLDSYTPKIFQNPYQSVFENEIWIREPQSWRFYLQEERQYHSKAFYSL